MDNDDDDDDDDDDDRLVEAAWRGRLRGVKEEKAAAAEMTAARISVRTMVNADVDVMALMVLGNQSSAQCSRGTVDR